MASSGSFNTSSYSGRYLTFSWSVKSTNIAGNYKEISWKLTGGGSASGYYKSGNFKVVIDGETVFSSSTRINLYNGTEVASGTKRIYHKSDGTKSFSASAQAGIYNVAVNCTGNNSWQLDTISRAPTYTSLKSSSITETSVTLTASIDTKTLELTNGGWDLSSDGGKTWDYHEGDITNKTITGLTPNTKYWYRGYAVTQGGGTNSSWYTFTTYDYPHCTNSPNFVIGDKVTLSFYNPLARSFDFYIICNGVEISNHWNINKTSYTGINAVSSQTQLYATIPNQKSATYKVKVVYGGITNIRDNGNTVTIKGTEVPTFTDFNYRDTNSIVTNITGDDQILIKGFSIPQVVISTANKMVGNNSANGASYTAILDTLTKSASYSADNNVNITLGTILSSGSKRLTVTTYDSRTLSTSAYKDVNILDYNKPIINATVTRLNSFEAQTTLSVSGEYTKINVNNIDKNTITSVKYRYREKEGIWSTWYSIITTINNGRFTCNDVIVTLDNSKSFDVEVEVRDNLSSHVEKYTVGVGKPIFLISTNKKKCYINGNQVVNAQVLYNNETGSNNTILLSDSVVNFECIEIFYKNDADVYSSTKIYHPNNKVVSLSVNYTNGVNSWVQIALKNIDGDTITTGNTSETNLTVNTGNSGNYIFITKVVGYNGEMEV